MPLYTYFNENTGEYRDIIQGMNDIHEYTDESGYKWLRVFYKPQAAIDTKMDEFSSRDFAEKTGRKKGTLGNLFDQSRELSEKRKQKEGIDFVKEKYYENYAKERKGKPHKDVMERNALKKLEKMGVTVEV